MKIEEILNEMWRTPIEAIDEAAMESWIKALEQHHKDLMGLVERWRAREQEYGRRGTDDYAFGLSQAYEYAADDLESLINPKD